MIGLGYGTKFSDGDLRELSRRSGISFDKLQEALGTLKQYRLKDGLLQRSTFVRPTGTFEFSTVVPEGNWRSVEFGGVTRRMTLRRHVVLTFHCTPVGPHRGRDPTVQAIIDASGAKQFTAGVLARRASLGRFIDKVRCSRRWHIGLVIH